MMPKLIRSLITISDEYSIAKESHSIYFKIGCIVVRVSDHMTCTFSTCDLAVFINSRGYTVIPTTGQFKEVKYFSSIEKLINFIAQFESIAKILLGNNPTTKTFDNRKTELNIISVQTIRGKLTDSEYQKLNNAGLISQHYEKLLLELFTKSKVQPSILVDQLKKLSGVNRNARIAGIQKLIKQYCQNS